MRLTPRRVLPVLCLSPVLLFNASCESMDALTDKVRENKETLIGGLAGTAAGATIGGLVAKKKGAIIGGAVGLVSGALIGNYYAKRERDRKQTTASVGYRPEQGNVFTITEANAAPVAAKAGESVKVNTKYTILRPDEDKALVKETREVRCNGSLVDSQKADVEMEQGEQRITWEYPIAKDAKPGTYEVLTTAIVEDKQASASTTFTIR